MLKLHDGDQGFEAGPPPQARDDDEWRGTVKVPDPLACMPAAQRNFGGRRREHPIYGGPFATPHAITGVAPAVFSEARIRSCPNTQHVTFHRVQSSFSSFSPKTRRIVSGLGPHEHVWRKELDVSPLWVDFEFQGAKVILGSGGGDAPGPADEDADDDDGRSYLMDWIGVDHDGLVHAGEIKAGPSYYLDPVYNAKLTGAERALARVGVVFHRDTGIAMRSNARRLLNIDRAYCDAFTYISPDQTDAIANSLARETGPVPLGRIEDAIGGSPAAAAGVARAALCRRMLSYDLDGVVDRDTPVATVRTPERIVDIRAIDKHVSL